MGFVNVYLMLAVFVSSCNNQWITEKRQAFEMARCIARCEKDKTCRLNCRDLHEEEEEAADDFSFQDRGFNVAANFNATLHCKNTDVIKLKHNCGIWVIEVSTAGEEHSWEFPTRIRVSEEGISSFTNLSAGSLYRFKAYRVTSTGEISEPESTPWFSTFEIDHQPEDIEAVELANEKSDEANPSRVRADIILRPASDRSCNYDIVSWNEDDGLTIGNFESLHDFNLTLRNLDYERNVTVLVSARNTASSRSSGNASLSFVTPSCLEIHRNVTLCAPDRVEGLRIGGMYENGLDYDIVVAWDEPNFLPDNYIVQIQSLDYAIKEPPILMTLPGNATEALLTLQLNETDHRRKIISIIAESSGGTSVPVSIHFTPDEMTTFDSFSPAKMPEMDDAERHPASSSSAFEGGIIASVVIVAVLLGCAYAYHVRRPTSRKRRDDKRYKYCRNLHAGKKQDASLYVIGKKGNLDFERNDEPLISKDAFEIRPIRLTVKNVLGSGASGIVRLGSLRLAHDRTINVAVKMLKDEPNSDDLKNFQHEISIMKSAGHHPNIVSMIGCCTIKVARPMLVVEYCSRGDLQTYLRTIWEETISRAFEGGGTARLAPSCQIAMRRDKAMAIDTKEYENDVNFRPFDKINGIEAHQVAITNKLYEVQEAYMLDTAEERVTAAELLNFARQVATGMEFLSSNRIIHRDLAARNVLLCEDKTVKISDFGLSRDIYEENVYKKQSNGRLPLKWMAIEALTHQIYTTQSDVWSFGILLWEIVTLGANPYPETPTNMVLQLLKTGYRMEKPENCGNELYDMMLSCWRLSSHSRPNFTQLKHQLDNLLRTVSSHEYLNLYELPREPNPRRRDSSTLDNKNYSNLYSA